jgi:hypothetical protein
MGRAWFDIGKHARLRALILVLLSSVLSVASSAAQSTGATPCNEGSDQHPSCAPGIPLADEFHAIPLIDGNTGLTYPPQPTANVETVTLYGAYGNDEQHSPDPAVQAHFNEGINRVPNIIPRQGNGAPNPNGSIVFLFIGFSNCTIETCGGDRDIWKDLDPNPEHVAGQPCATFCPNPKKFPPQGYTPWNQTIPFDQVTQKSFLYQVYSPQTPLVGPPCLHL